MIETMGIASKGDDILTSILYKHGGDLDSVEVFRGARLYLPVSIDGHHTR